MHSFLIVGKDKKQKEKKIKDLVKGFDADRVDFKLEKIKDARELGAFVKLKTKNPTVLVIKNINKASTEALNAFLKNLEEPQENLYFITTARSVHNILPTIISRSQVINISSSSERNVSKQPKSFVNSDNKKRMTIINKIKKRDESINFLKDVLTYSHKVLLRNKDKKTAVLTHEAQKALVDIEKNANVTLTLTRLIANLNQ